MKDAGVIGASMILKELDTRDFESLLVLIVYRNPVSALRVWEYLLMSWRLSHT